MDMTPSFRLLMTPRSPFARRVWLALRRLDLPFQREDVAIFEPTEEFFHAAPLGLVPVLGLPSGENLPDSNMILEHLHEAYGRKIWPTAAEEALQVRLGSAFAVGLMTATVSRYLESLKKVQDPDTLNEYFATLERTLQKVGTGGWDAGVWRSADGKLTQAGWDLGGALDYLDLRVPQLNWREKYPRLPEILEKCRTSQDFRQSAPPP